MLARDRALAALLAALPGLAASALVQAQGLGEIALHSSLNEPLDATIPLFQLDGLDESQIRVAMASDSDFARSDIPRPDFLRLIEFELEIDGDTGLLHLTSAEPVVEPYLNFLVDARWPSGRMLREYTVLLDLPTFSQAAAAPVQPAARAPEPAPAPRRETPAPASREPVAAAQFPRSEPAREEPAPAEERASGPAGEEDLAGPAGEESVDGTAAAQAAPAPEAPAPEEERAVEVAPNDTLWQIALENRPRDSVSVQQMMLAIQRANGDAFIDGNINGLRTGEVLRIPTIDEVLAVNREQAYEQVALQNSRFNPAAGELDAQPLVGGGEGEGPSTLEGGDELSVLTGGDAQDDGAGGEADAAVAELETALMLSEENLDRATLENEELRSRLADLEAQIETLQNIIAIEDQRLAQMQAELAAEAEAEAATAAAAPAPAEEAQAVEPAPAPVETAAANAGLPALLNTLMRNPLVMGGGLAGLVLLVLGFLIWRRRRDEQDRDEEEVFQSGAESEAPAPAEAAVAAAPAMAREEPEFNEQIWEEEGEQENAAQVPDWLSQDPDFSLDDDEGDSPEASADDAGEEGLEMTDFSLTEGEDGEDLGGENVLEEDFLAAGEEGAADFGLEDDLNLELDEDEPAGAGSLEVGDAALSDDSPLAGETSLSEEPSLSGENSFEHLPSEEASLPEDSALSEELPLSGDTLPAEEPEVVEFSLDEPAASEPEPRREEEPLESFEFRLDEAEPAASAPLRDTGEEAENLIEFSLDAPEAPAAVQEEEEVIDIAFDVDEEEEGGIDGLSWQGGESAVDGAAEATDLDIEFEGLDDGDAVSAAAPAAEDDPLDLGNLDIDEELLKMDDEEDDLVQPLTDRDEVATKLDLAVAYEAMGDLEGALEILDEVIDEGSETQAGEARELKSQWSKTEAGE